MKEGEAGEAMLLLWACFSINNAKEASTDAGNLILFYPTLNLY